ncbi:MAG TPA: CAP domain-containing protein, partial [Sandaracinaceae bacterium]
DASAHDSGASAHDSGASAHDSGAHDSGASAHDSGASAHDSGAHDSGGPAPAGCTAVGLELIELVNAYRADNGLPAIPASPSLCTVAAAHTRDLAENAPHTEPGCNLHSWSDRGSWTPCCYTPDHAAAQCMWDKPRELTEYPGNGYENAFAGRNDPQSALMGWQSSPAHDDVILNRGIWADRPWRALGADVHGGFAVLWFGHEDDPAD